MANPVSRPLLLALALSLLAHLLMVAGADFTLPDWTEAEEPLQVSLPPLPRPAPLPAPTMPAPSVEAPAKPKPATKHPPPPPADTPPRHPMEQVAAEPMPPPVEELVSPSKIDPPAPQPPSEPVAEAPPQPEPVTEAPQQPPDEAPASVPAAPRRVEMTYQILRGANGGVVGKVKRIFRLEGEDHYVLESVAEATGLVSLFYSGKYEEYSEGTVTAHGLQPSIYKLKRGSGKSQSATFDWTLGSVALDSGDNHAVVEAPPGAQDMLSFLYQFMFVPPLVEMHITVANGKKLKTYAYGFEGEEWVDTRMGRLRTWHIVKLNADRDDKVELWLAADHRFLPIRIRQTERGGTVTELMMTSLSIE
jgi:hypothetical protein